MVTVSCATAPATQAGESGVVVGALADDDAVTLAPSARAVDAAAGGELASFLTGTGFDAKEGSVAVVPGAPGGPGVVVVVGLGEAGSVTPDVLRRASGTAARAAPRQVSLATTLAEILPANLGEASQAVTEGTLLGAYRFDRFKSGDGDPRLERVTVLGGDEGGVRRGEAYAAATALARDLANTPAGDMAPAALAAAAERLASERLAVEVWDEERIRSERLGGLLAVNAGSALPPRLIRLSYTPPGDVRGTVVLVGKGITFDSGGLSLKTAESMTTMKTDKSGAAAVLGAMSALAFLAPPVRVLAIVPATENMPSGTAVKPGDVFTARNAKTVEVLNTDAEGRLVLADALALAAEEAPDAIVDVATLTGACLVALGDKWAGLLSNDDAVAGAVEAAARRAGEPVWRLPLPPEYRKHLDSEVADLKNIGVRNGGALTAGLFLQEFVGDVPWAHLDIAGPARAESDESYVPKGATGFATRTLLEFVEVFSPPGGTP